MRCRRAYSALTFAAASVSSQKPAEPICASSSPARCLRPTGSKVVREQGQLLTDGGETLRGGLGRRARHRLQVSGRRARRCASSPLPMIARSARACTAPAASPVARAALGDRGERGVRELVAAMSVQARRARPARRTPDRPARCARARQAGVPDVPRGADQRAGARPQRDLRADGGEHERMARAAREHEIDPQALERRGSVLRPRRRCGAATAVAVERGERGIYNVVDDDPAPARQWMPELARALGAKPPRRVPRWLGRLLTGEAATVMLTEVRGASNEKAKREFGWKPRFASWRQGSRRVSAERWPTSSSIQGRWPIWARSCAGGAGGLER